MISIFFLLLFLRSEFEFQQVGSVKGPHSPLLVAVAEGFAFFRSRPGAENDEERQGTCRYSRKYLLPEKKSHDGCDDRYRSDDDHQ
jgi:hypothetical protein